MSTQEQREQFLLNDFDVNKLDTAPKTEKELLEMYCCDGDALYRYIQGTVNPFLRPLSNELRAMLGHLAAYRMKEGRNKNELDKAYGHFRRFIIDGLKILCDEFDKALLLQLKKQYKYDFRAIEIDYLKKYSVQYFKAKNFYLCAQKEERVGSDRGAHNLIDLYYHAAKEYIQLKQLYLEKKPIFSRLKRRIIIRNIAFGIMSAFGIIVSLIGLFF